MKSILLKKFYDFAKNHLEFEKYFASFIQDYSNKNAPVITCDIKLIQSLASLVVFANAKGHVCLDLSQNFSFQHQDETYEVIFPESTALKEDLVKGVESAIIAFTSENNRPLIYAEKPYPRIYLNRYWHYERSLEKDLEKRNYELLKNEENPASVDQFFPEANADPNQRSAVENSLRSSFSIISGGPGTGKTTVAVKIIASSLIQNPNLKIAIAAPTGKAANRLDESIRNSLSQLNHLPSETSALLKNLKGQTLHRLLGYKYNSTEFKHNKNNPLPYDLIIVDEASMIDLPMMSKLMSAIAGSSKFILIGDPYQLPSVEVGSIFNDITRSKIVKNKYVLTKNYRAAKTPELIKLLNLIKSGEADLAVEYLKLGLSTIKWRPIKKSSDLNRLLIQSIEKYSTLLNTNDLEKTYKVCLNYRILTLMREGQFGMENLNDKIEANLIDTHSLIIINKNDPETGLFNGDTGIMIKDQNYAWFPSIGKLSSYRLPAHSKAYVMTGHRSQGSEFDEIQIVLPTDSNSPLLTREWLYTAVSRAKNQVTLWANEASLRKAIETRTERSSGFGL